MIPVRVLHPAIGKNQARNLLRMDCGVGYCDWDRVVVGDHREARQFRTLNHCLGIAYHRVHRKIDRFAVRKARPSRVVPDQMEALRERRIDMSVRFPCRLHVAKWAIRHHQQGRAIAGSGEGDIYAIARLRVLDARLHHAPSSFAHSRTRSPTPFSDCSPRSSNMTPALVRARPRTISETRTSPGADRPLMREAMLTAPP